MDATFLRTLQANRVETEGRTIRQVMTELNEKLRTFLPEDVREGCSFGPGLSWELWEKPWPERYFGVACYVIRGGSEGYYVHVDITFRRESYATDRREALEVAFDKVFDWCNALAIANACGVLLSW